MYDDIARHGGRPIMWKTGHSLIKSKLKEEHAALAGEMSGHMFFNDRYLRLRRRDLRVVPAARNRRAAKAAARRDSGRFAASHFTPEIRVDCPDDRKFEVVRKAADYFRAHYETIDIDGARVNFPGGWGLVRASNTQPALVMRFEATTEKRSAKFARCSKASSRNSARSDAMPERSAPDARRGADYRGRPRHSLLAREPRGRPKPLFAIDGKT